MFQERSIQKHVQLATIDNDCCLFSRQYLQRNLDVALALSEFSADPTKTIFVTKDRQVQSYIGGGRKQVIEYVQAIKFRYINKNGLVDFDEEKFPLKLYVDFLKLENKAELDDSFCVFPNEGEMMQLAQEYEKAGIDGSLVPVALFGYKLEPEREKQIAEMQKTIREINLDFVWKKQEQLKKYVGDYLGNKLREDQILWLNRQLENVSLKLADKNNMTRKRIAEGYVFDGDDRTLGEIIGRKMFKELVPTEEYRVYGHFALCCLELFLDMQTSLPFFTCEECGQLNYKGPESKRKHCTRQENEACHLQRWRDRTSKSARFKK